MRTISLDMRQPKQLVAVQWRWCPLVASLSTGQLPLPLMPLHLELKVRQELRRRLTFAIDPQLTCTSLRKAGEATSAMVCLTHTPLGGTCLSQSSPHGCALHPAPFLAVKRQTFETYPLFQADNSESRASLRSFSRAHVHQGSRFGDSLPGGYLRRIKGVLRTLNGRQVQAAAAGA